jgi:uncharacterized membrane protein
MYCRNCGKEVAPGTEVCAICGVKIDAGKYYCPNCGAQTSELAEFCANCGAKLTSFPTQKPTALQPGVILPYKYGWNKLWPNFWILFLVGLVSFAISGAISGISQAVKFFSIISLFVSIPLGYGQSFCCLRAARDGEVKFEEMFNGFKCYWNSLGAGLLSALIIAGGFILLIVPGIIFACKLAFVPYLVVDRKMGPTEAISTSWKMTKGHTMEIFLMGLLAIPIVIAGLICLGVGVIVAGMWVSMAFASIYYAVSATQNTPAKSPVQV